MEGDDFRYSYSGQYNGYGETYNLETCYADGRVYETNQYGSFTAETTAEYFQEYCTDSHISVGLSRDEHETIEAERADGGTTITYSGTGGLMYGYLEDFLAGSGFTPDSSDFTYSGTAFIPEDGYVSEETIQMDCGGTIGTDAASVSVTVTTSVNKMDDGITVTVPDASGYTEVSDVRIPTLLIAAYDDFLADANVQFYQTAERTYTASGVSDVYEERFDVAMAYPDAFHFSILGEIALNGSTYESSMYYDGTTLIDIFDGEQSTSTDYTLSDIFSLVQSYQGEYAVLSLDYVENLTMTEQGGTYVIEYDYTDEYTDMDVDYYANLYDMEDMSTYMDSVEYIQNHATVSIDALTGDLLSHNVATQANYTADGTTLEVVMNYQLDVTARDGDVQVTPAPGTDI